MDIEKLASICRIDKLPNAITWTQLHKLVELVVATEREEIIASIPGGCVVDPQWVCDMIRDRPGPRLNEIVI